MARKSTIQDVIDALEEALDAAEEISDGCETEAGGKQSAVDAINQIRVGDYAGAITTLEREFLPKWNNKLDAEADYKRSMAARPEPKEWL